MSSTSIYCTYVTFYSGNKLPPFYIGSSSVEKVNNGYHGSVRSKKWREIYKSEIKNNSNLFRTEIISTFDVRKDATQYEYELQKVNNVVKSPWFFNESLAIPNGFFGMDISGDLNPMKNPENKKRHLEITTSVEHRIKQSNGVKPRVENGTHHFLGPATNKTRVGNGTHQFIGGEIQGKTSRRRVLNGTHNFIGMYEKQIANGTHPSQIKWICEVCQKSGSGSTNYKRWHGPNCRSMST